MKAIYYNHHALGFGETETGFAKYEGMHGYILYDARKPGKPGDDPPELPEDYFAYRVTIITFNTKNDVDVMIERLQKLKELMDEQTTRE